MTYTKMNISPASQRKPLPKWRKVPAQKRKECVLGLVGHVFPSPCRITCPLTTAPFHSLSWGKETWINVKHQAQQQTCLCWWHIQHKTRTTASWKSLRQSFGVPRGVLAFCSICQSRGHVRGAPTPCPGLLCFQVLACFMLFIAKGPKAVTP